MAFQLGTTQILVQTSSLLINLLIDNNYEADDIKSAFRGDKEMLGALKGYAEQHDIEEDYEEFEEDEDQDEDW